MVAETTGAMFCKSARISLMGFSGLVSFRKPTLPEKPYFFTLDLANVLMAPTITITIPEQIGVTSSVTVATENIIKGVDNLNKIAIKFASYVTDTATIVVIPTTADKTTI